MKKRLAYLLVLALLISVLALSGCGEAAPTPYDGKWIAVGAEAFGIQVPVEDLYENGFDFTILGEGKLELNVDGDSSKEEWSVSGDSFTLTVSGQDSIGTIGEDVIVFDDMFGSGVKMFFAKEGSAACDPALYDNMDEMIDGLMGDTEPQGTQESPGSDIRDLTPEIAVGSWECVLYATSVEDPGSDDPSPYNVSSLPEMLSVNFYDNYTADIFYMGEALGLFAWDIQDGKLLLQQGDNIEFDVYYFVSGNMEIDVYEGDSYMEYYCSKK